jgi:hypothetical protein
VSILAAVLVPFVQLGAAEPNPPGQLGADLAVGSTPDFIREWVETPPAHGVKIPRVKTFRRGETAYFAVLVTGYLRDEAGRVHVELDLHIDKPDGSVLAHQENYARCAGVVEDRPAFLIADPGFDVGFEEGDPLGDYSVTVILHDRVAKKGAILMGTVTLVDGGGTAG